MIIRGGTIDAPPVDPPVDPPTEPGVTLTVVRITTVSSTGRRSSWKPKVLMREHPELFPLIPLHDD